MQREWICRLAVAWAAYGFLSLACGAVRADAPSAAQALALTPIQPNVAYAKPTKEEVAGCTIRAEKQAGITAWVVRDSQGQTLRRFADTNGDNVVDLWCYFSGGLEVYRDIDADHDGKADQYRWLQTAGTRWGIDKNQDGRVDYWQAISAPEVAEELVWALKTKDQKRFELLLLTPDELASVGFSKPQADRLAAALKAAPAAFSKLAAEQKLVIPKTEFADFYRSRPATIPAGTDGSTKDVTILDNASALVETGDKHDQLFLGTMVSIGQTWKILDVPTLGADNQTQPSGLMAASAPDAGGAGIAGGPSDEMQQLMAELEKLDQQAEKTAPADQATLTEKRADILQKLASTATDDDSRSDWIKQLADVLSAAVQSGNYPQGIDSLTELGDKLAKNNPNDTVIPYVEFRRMWAAYAQSQQAKDADLAKIQEKWLADLEAFANKYPKNSDAAEALLQLGMANEFGGKTDDAQKWYQKLVDGFSKSSQAATARGALTRLGSQGKPIVLRGMDTVRKKNIDLSAAPYHGKVVAIYYWATWCDHCKERMDSLNDVYAKWGGARGFDVIGVCLDKTPEAMQTFLKANPTKWAQIYDDSGRLANDMGVMTLPLMILVDQKGNVVSDNIYLEGLEPELQRLLGTTTAQGSSALPAK